MKAGRPARQEGMSRVLSQFGDVACHRPVDPRLQLLHQLHPGAEQIAGRLGPAAQGLAQEFTGLGMQADQCRVQFGVEVVHPGKAFRRLQVESAHQRVIAAEGFAALILEHPPGGAEDSQAVAVPRRARQTLFTQAHRLLGGARQ